MVGSSVELYFSVVVHPWVLPTKRLFPAEFHHASPCQVALCALEHDRHRGGSLANFLAMKLVDRNRNLQIHCGDVFSLGSLGYFGAFRYLLGSC